MGELLFEACEIPATNRLGVEGGGNCCTWHGMGTRVYFGARSSLNGVFAQTDHQVCVTTFFFPSICKFKQFANKIVDMKLRLEHARL